MNLSAIIRKAIEIGDQQGFVTFDQINELVPADRFEPEMIEDLLEALRDHGIDVRDLKVPRLIPCPHHVLERIGTKSI